VLDTGRSRNFGPITAVYEDGQLARFERTDALAHGEVPCHN
jgi:hypothetical protein